MSSERSNCGIGSLISISCKDRAEAFARSLQSRLSSLGTQNSPSDERSWLGPHEKPIALSQPIHQGDAEKFLQLEQIESPCSPQEEIEESELHKLLNKDNLRESTNDDCQCKSIEENKFYIRANGLIKHHSLDSDTEVFYDLDDDPLSHPYVNGFVHSDSSKSIESETGIDVNSQGTSSSDAFATSLDCTPQPSVSDDVSTLSFRDENSILEVNGISENNCEDCKRNREGKTDGKNETDKRYCEDKDDHDEGYVNEDVLNGTDESETYVSNLTISSELVLECKLEKNIVVSAELENCNTVEIEKSEEIVDECSERDNSTLDSPEPAVIDNCIEIENAISTETEDCSEIQNEDEDNDDDGVIPRVRRCSSLKTGKTPPGTPGRKKIVRFADVLGLDLADVKTFVDEIPKVPKSAYNDLSNVDISDSSSEIAAINAQNKYHGIKSERILVPLFEQPSGQPTFLDLVRDNLVCLENALVDDPILFLIKGTVRVRNLDFHKSVHIRYTLDSWKTFADVQGSYVNNSCDGFSDRFTFTIYAHTLTVGQKLEFACRFSCKGSQYWDSNKGKNYVFQCLPSASSSTSHMPISHGHADWSASFY